MKGEYSRQLGLSGKYDLPLQNGHAVLRETKEHDDPLEGKKKKEKDQ